MLFLIHGFVSAVEHPQDLSAKKDELGVPARARSCHTAVSKQGYVFEGHIPAKYVQQFLQSPPENALGLVVPAMPVGSPGMEVGNKFMPYDIFVFNKDGSSNVYASVTQAGDQF